MNAWSVRWLLILGVTVSHAVAADPIVARGLSANPDAANVSLAVHHDGDVTGHFGLVASVYGDPARDGLFLQFLPVFEVEGPVIPYAHWRGRLGFEGGLAWSLQDRASPPRLILALGLEHESDHLTETPSSDDQWPTAVVINDIALRADLVLPRDGWSLVATAIERLHVLTCTTDAVSCTTGTRGDVGFGQTLEVLAMAEQGWAAPFVALSGEWVTGAELIEQEARIDLRLGVRAVGGRDSQWHLALLGRLGSVVGVRRGLDDAMRLGIVVGTHR